MQIVIEIQDATYKDIMDAHNGVTKRKLNGAGLIIAKGIPLPKGHARLIEVTPELEARLDTYQRYTGIDEAPYEYASEELAKAKTAVEADKGEEND